MIVSVLIGGIENCILLNPEPNLYFVRDTITLHVECLRVINCDFLGQIIQVSFIPESYPGPYSLTILFGSAAIVILTRLCRVISKAVVVVVNLINALLQNRHDVVKGAKTVRVVFATWIGAVDGNDGIVAALEC